jgi:hypothetical protein
MFAGRPRQPEPPARPEEIAASGNRSKEPERRRKHSLDCLPSVDNGAESISAATSSHSLERLVNGVDCQSPMRDRFITHDVAPTQQQKG